MAGSSASLLSTAATASVVPAALSSARSSVNGAGFVQVAGVCRAPVSSKALTVTCNAGQDVNAQESSVSRRAALSLLAAVASVGAMRASPAHAAYGESANIFGSLKPETGFTTYTGDGFSFSLPSKWNPSKEVEYPGQVVRYEDNFDALTNLMVSVLPSSKSSIKDYGSPEAFLKACAYLLGKQSYKGKTVSEGGFDPNLVSSANIFKADEVSVNGKPYYFLSVLTRTGDGTEGGRHQYIVGTVSGSKLYIFKAQAGDKRWFKGAQRFVETAASSFTVA